MAERNVYYRLAGLIEVDDPKSGTRGRGAAGKAKVVVAEETKRQRPGFASMRKVKHLSGDDISKVLANCLEQSVVSRRDGWRA